MRRPEPMFNARAGDLVELMLVAAAATVLAIRAFLAATGYPQIGGNGLHIAHLLWGGIGLALAMIIALSIIGVRAQVVAALLAGVGFGFFIDEVGKFVTSDNNYFYKPAIGLIYISFVIIALILRWLRARPLTPSSAFGNALFLIADAQHRGLDVATKERVLVLLDRADAADPGVAAIRAGVAATPAAPVRTGRLARTRRRAEDAYVRVAGTKTFTRLVILSAILFLVIEMPVVSTALLNALGIGNQSVSTLTAIAILVNAIVLVATAVGIWHLLRHRRLEGLSWIRLSILLSLILAQPFLFWSQEFAALPGFVASVIAYSVLGFALDRERELRDPAAPR